MLVLVCAAGVTGGDCRPETATDVWYAEPAATFQQCIENGELSGTLRSPPREYYLKIVCLPKRQQPTE